jgi:hypothetical protein
MNAKRRRHLIELAELEQAAVVSRRRRRWIIAGVILVIAAFAAFLLWPAAKPPPKETAKPKAQTFPTLEELVQLKPHQLEETDIALMNLICAQGLRGAEGLDIQKMLARIDEIAARVRVETERHLYRFTANPGEYQNSEAYFRMLYLVGVIQQDFGIRYNPERVSPVGVIEPSNKFFADSRDVFIHGIAGPPGLGTCSSLPIFGIAIGRRLHYPLSLVSAKGHLFMRWENEKERLNIESASLGMNTHDDDHYRKWPYPMTDEEEKEDGYMRNLNASEELSIFLSIRGACLMAQERFEESIKAHEHAARLAPKMRKQQAMVELAKRDVAQRKLKTSLGIGMPPDPSLWDLPRDVAWAEWKREREERRIQSLPGVPRDPVLGIPQPPPHLIMPPPNHGLPRSPYAR